MRVAAASALGTLVGSPARASLGRAVRLEELAARSQHVLLGETLDADSVWEQIGRRKHIVTYSRVRALEVLGGAAPGQDELMLRTLGGYIGELGELVHGEASLTLGSRSVLFVMPVPGALAITAMAQGHYPLLRDKAGAERLQRSPHAAEIVADAGAALTRLPGLSLSEARSLLKPVRK